MALLTLIFAASLSFAASPSHQEPVPSVSAPRSSANERQNLLAEFWQRRILSPDVDQWSPQDMELLLRARAAEAAGAFAYLRARLKTLKGSAVDYRPIGSSTARPRLTKEGFLRYLSLKSQEALQYFESREVEAKWAFKLRDLQGNRIFSEDGQLTQAGDDLYSLAAAGRPAFWRSPNGEVSGNRRALPPAAN